MGKALLLGVLLAAGCGATDGEPVGDPQPALVGNWVIAEAGGAIGLDFSGNGYAFGVLQTTAGSTLNTQVEKGTFVASATRITFTPEQWTCDGTKAPYVFGYTSSSTSLVLQASDGVLAFTPNQASGGSALLTYGCFDSAGAFTPHPIGPAR